MRTPEENERVVFVLDHDGREPALAALDGWRVLEVIRDWGVEVAAECRCRSLRDVHVYVDETWVERIDPPSVDEFSRLDEARRSTLLRTCARSLLLEEPAHPQRITLQCEIIHGRLDGKLFEPSLLLLSMRDDFPPQQAQPLPCLVFGLDSVAGTFALRSFVAYASLRSGAMPRKFGAVR